MGKQMTLMDNNNDINELVKNRQDNRKDIRHQTDKIINYLDSIEISYEDYKKLTDYIEIIQDINLDNKTILKELKEINNDSYDYIKRYDF